MTKRRTTPVVLIVVFIILAVAVLFIPKHMNSKTVTPTPTPTPSVKEPPTCMMSVSPISIYIPQGESGVLVVTLSSSNPNTLSLSLDSPIGDVPPFIDAATFDPDTVTVRPNQQATSNLTLKINSKAPIGGYSLSVNAGNTGIGFTFYVIPASGEIPAELPLYSYQNGTRIPASFPAPLGPSGYPQPISPGAGT